MSYRLYTDRASKLENAQIVLAKEIRHPLFGFTLPKGTKGKIQNIVSKQINFISEPCEKCGLIRIINRLDYDIIDQCVLNADMEESSKVEVEYQDRKSFLKHYKLKKLSDAHLKSAEVAEGVKNGAYIFPKGFQGTLYVRHKWISFESNKRCECCGCQPKIHKLDYWDFKLLDKEE